MPPFPGTELLDAFRTHYNRLQNSVADIIQNPTDAVVIARLGDDLDEFMQLVQQHSEIFDVAELATIQTSRRGRPRIHIDPDFLEWSYSQRTTAGIWRFLGVSRNTVRSALLREGIATPQSNPFPNNMASAGPAPHVPDDAEVSSGDDSSDSDDLLEADLPIPAQLQGLPPEIEDLASGNPPITSYSGPLSEITDCELDNLLLRLRSHFRRAGLGMLDGMLRRLGHRVQRERITQSLLRIDPVRRIFERIRIRRRIYSVPGPNYLWHHDGQHGKSVHNVRIERLWVDVTVQLGAMWAERFTILELRHGLDINNIAHIWLLHFLFLATINSQLAFFAESWNQHRIQIRHGPNRSPADMFVFDMLVHGVRGNQLPDEEVLNEEELEVYGIDWAGLRDDDLLASQRTNNPTAEGATSWVGRVGPPPLSDLSSVVVDSPADILSEGEDLVLYNAVVHLLGSAQDEDCINLWIHALAYARLMHPDLF
ncbi:hypothetical protein GGX14DRAFT_372621 [Mycena pura]|uniref:Integrase core domain-containing protein n=1 Tax=Mycena pura TaxID=153505 RepID=A0AAD6V8G9_9AGAR|nr:hypothetical protein GGX14DRAFT_372621 [Mycena pura]